MFEKRKLKKQIKKCVDEINLLESKRSRSQSALVQAILTHTTPDDEDVEFFNLYTSKINEVRDRMKEFKIELEKLENTK